MKIKSKKKLIHNKIIFPKKTSNKEIIEFFKKKKLFKIISESKRRDLEVNEIYSNQIYKPVLTDLYRLYKFCILNKRTTILEFGSGFSSLIFAIALDELKEKFSDKIKKLRRNNPFQLFSLDNEKKYLKISKNRVEKYFSKKCRDFNFLFSEVYMKNYNGLICNEYKKLPLCNPDLIYLDGPDQTVIKNNINGITSNYIDFMPMNSDILKIEFYLTPGTIIICDGRGANANFLKKNFKRNWLYTYEEQYDQHIFYLNDNPIGKYNKAQMRFYKS